MRAPWAEHQGWSISAQRFLGSEIPRLRNSSTEEFLESGVPGHPRAGEHPRVVPGQPDQQISVNALLCDAFRGSESMAMEFHGNVCGEVWVNFLGLFASKPHIPIK